MVAKKTGAKRAPNKSKTAPKAEKINKAEFKAEANGAENFIERAREVFEERAERVMDAFAGVRERFADMRLGATDVAEVLRNSWELAASSARDVNMQIIDFAQADLNRLFDAQRKMLKAKSLREAAEIQANFFRTQFELGVKQTRKVSEMAVESTKEVFEPITTGFSEMLEKTGLRKAA
ncbi:MAG TPA: TIGR01841 family phasin [Micropepsaceae bacterium]|nr:TIGR01841 family phasin [Micropepsaceae bacterium]